MPSPLSVLARQALVLGNKAAAAAPPCLAPGADLGFSHGALRSV